MANPATQSTEQSAAKDGTIHVKVLRARNLPTMDFGKRQDPFVRIQLEGASPKPWAVTDPVFQGGTNPEWTEQLNNELELFFDASEYANDVILTVEVFTDESGDDLIGTGQVNVAAVVRQQKTTETEYTVRLKDGLGGSANRGEVVLAAWFGPPVRKAFRAAQRASKLLDARDSLVGTVYKLFYGAVSPFAKYFRGPVDVVKKNRKLGAALAVVASIFAAGAVALFLFFAIPTAIVATLTFPFWIVPFLLTSFFTSPLWMPILVITGAFLAFVGTFVLGLGVTSLPVRRKGALLTTKIKNSDVGKRVVYEKDD